MRSTAWLLFLSVACCQTASHLPRPQRPAPAETLARQGQPLSAVTRDFELIDNRVFLRAQINGQGPFSLVLDTGMHEGLLLSSAVAAQLRLSINGSEQKSGAGARRELAGKTEVASFDIGAIHLERLPTIVMSLDDIGRAVGFERFDGVVGYELFRRFVVIIDFERRQVQFADPLSFGAPRKVQSIPLTFDGTAPLAAGTVAKTPGTFFVDTGDRSAISLCVPFAKANDINARLHPKVTALTGWGVGGPIRGEVGRLSAFSLGSASIESPIVRLPDMKTGVFASEHFAGLVGNGFLKRFRVTIDYRGARLFLEPTAQTAAWEPYDRSGMWLGLDPAGWRVMDVIDGGPADRAGIRVDDLVLSIDGKTRQKTDLDSIRSLLRSKDLEMPIAVALKSNATSLRRVELWLQDIL